MRKPLALTLTPADEGRFWMKVNRGDGCWLWTACTNKDGYGLFSLKLKSRLAHRVAYTLLRGPIPEGLGLDHRCHAHACVNPGHLRPATDKQNKENPSGPTKLSTSGVLGVCWHKGAGKWMAQVHHAGVNNYVGLFADLHDADVAVTRKRNELFTFNDADRSPK